MKSIQKMVQDKPYVGWALFAATMVVVFLVGILGASIVQRRAESVRLPQSLIAIETLEADSSVWGINFPRQYDRWLKTADTSFQSKFGGSAMVDELDRHPNLVVIWAGYAFSRDYNQGRGHQYAVKDVQQSLRIDVPQTSTCWTCKSSDVPGLMEEMGVAEFYKAPIADLGPKTLNPLGCADCHDSETMSLQITRPALVEAFDRMGRDIRQSTHQQMRSLVCAQCHVEYYFSGPDRYIVFPWDDGLRAEEMEHYFDRINFTDFTHALSRSQIIKPQHPDWELYKEGVHAKRGVSCADCHMPYRTEGGVKVTDHKVQSPLNNIANACQTCHRESEATLRQSVYDSQDTIRQLRDSAEANLVRAHIEAKAAWDAGATEAQMADILLSIRHSQWRWDFVAASHGGAFHAPLESARLVASSIEKSGEARLKLSRLLQQLGVTQPVAMPDLSTKEKAQAYIGLDMPRLRADKRDFVDNILPTWWR